MKFAQNNHPTSLFGPTILFGTWEYLQHSKIEEEIIKSFVFWYFFFLKIMYTQKTHVIISFVII